MLLTGRKREEFPSNPSSARLKFHASVDNSIICLFRHFLCTFPAVKSWGNSAICTSNIWIINHESFVCAVIQCLQSIFFYIILLMLRFGRRSHEKTAVTADINLAERFLWQQNETKGNKIHWLHGVRFFGTLSNRRCTGRFSVGTCAHWQTHWALSHLKHLYLWWSVKELLPILLWASVCVCVCLYGLAKWVMHLIVIRLRNSFETFLLICNKCSVQQSRLTHK